MRGRLYPVLPTWLRGRRPVTSCRRCDGSGMLSGSLRLFCPSCDVGDILRPGWTVTTVRRRLNLSEALGVGQAVALRRMTEAAQRLVAAITHRSGT